VKYTLTLTPFSSFSKPNNTMSSSSATFLKDITPSQWSLILNRLAPYMSDNLSQNDIVQRICGTGETQQQPDNIDQMDTGSGMSEQEEMDAYERATMGC
jgi:hypothetical protein